MSIQSSINSMLGSVAQGTLAVKGLATMKNKQSTMQSNSPQMMASSIAQQSVSNEIEAKKNQKNELLSLFQNMNKVERKEFLRESQHYQAQEKRGGK